MMKMTSELLKLWTECYGSTYKEVLGGRLVSWFRYEGSTYRMGDVVDVIADGALSGDYITTGEIVSAGSTMVVPSPSRCRRAIILKIVSSCLGEQGEPTGVFLWSDHPNHIRHNPLHTLARMGD